MSKQLTFMRIVAVAALAAGAMNSANANIFFRTRVVVAPTVVAPVAVAPVAVAPVVAAPVTPVVVAAPVPVVPVYVPTCRLVAVPFVNAWTGVAYSVTRRVCN